MAVVPFTRYAHGIAITPLGTFSVPAGLAQFTPLNTLVQPAILGQIADVQSVWMDAALANDPVTLRNVQTRQYQTWPRGSYGWQNLMAKTDAMQLELQCFSAVTIGMSVANVPLAAFVTDAGIIQSSIYSTVTRIAAAIADTSIVIADGERQGFGLYNDSTATLYLLLSADVATTVNYSVRVPPLGYFETPYAYGGAARGIWSAANGAAQVTEFY